MEHSICDNYILLDSIWYRIYPMSSIWNQSYKGSTLVSYNSRAIKIKHFSSNYDSRVVIYESNVIIKLINVDYLNCFFPNLLESNFEVRPHDGR